MLTKIGNSFLGQDILAFSNFDLDLIHPNSSEGAVIEAAETEAAETEAVTLLIGGTHGDESATVPLLDQFIETQLKTKKVNTPTVVIPLLNPDGFARSTRYNGRGIDLNRNFPHGWNAKSEEPAGAHPLSEPEALALHNFILKYQPKKIVSLHWALAELDADGKQSETLLGAMWNSLDKKEQSLYRKRISISSQSENGVLEKNSLFGSLGQWCGYGMVYEDQTRPAMVTLELPYHIGYQARPESLPENHLDVVRDHWNNRQQDYLDHVESHVQRILTAACLHKIQI